MEQKNKASIWKPITIGTFSAIMFTTVSSQIMKRLEERDAAYHSKEKDDTALNDVSSERSFQQSFQEARQQRGTHSAFTWKGNVYSTATKEEWEHLPEAQKNDIIEQIDPSALDVIEVNDNYANDDVEVSEDQTIDLADVNMVDSDAKDMVYEEEDVSQVEPELSAEDEDDVTMPVSEEEPVEDLAMNDDQEASVMVVEEGHEDIDDDVHIISSGDISDVEVMMMINGNEDQDVVIIDMDDDYEDSDYQDVLDVSQNQVDISTQVDYIDPKVTDSGDGIDADNMYFT